MTVKPKHHQQASNQQATAKQWQDGLWIQNPALVQLLGLCPLLAVSTTFTNGLYLGLATLAVLVLGNTGISLCKSIIPFSLRLPSFMLIFATMTTITELLLQAFHYGLYSQLGLFIPLILTNCTLLARAEAFASKQPVLSTIRDSTAMGLGFLLVLVLLGAIRGALTPYSVLMAIPPGAFFVFGLFIALQQWFNTKNQTANANQTHNGTAPSLHKIKTITIDQIHTTKDNT